MIAVCLPMLCLGCLLSGVTEAAPLGFLHQPAACLDDLLRGPPRPYLPQPGDVILSTDRSAIIRAGHVLAGSTGVHHSAIVFARPDGTPAVLEAGPFNSLRVQTLDPLELLTGHERRGEAVWVRQRAVPLTPEQSERLTAWALAQDGRSFAGLRMLRQLTPVRSRGPLRTYCLGRPHGERHGYFCSELVMESLVAAGVVCPDQARPPATYPRDLFFDHSANPFLDEHPPLGPCWLPPARWTGCP